MPDTAEGAVTDKEGSFHPLCFFRTENQELFASVGRDVTSSMLASTVLENGAGPKFIFKRSNESGWHFSIRLVQSPGLLEVSKRTMKFISLSYIIVCSEDSRVRIAFHAVLDLAVDYLFKTSVTDHPVKNVLRGLQKRIFHNFFFVATTVERFATKPKMSLTIQLDH